MLLAVHAQCTWYGIYVAVALTLSSQSERVVGIGEIFTQEGKELLHQLPLGIVFKAPVE
jgi:hypothetical protein